MKKHPDLFALHPYLIVGGLLLEEVPHQLQPCMTIERYGLVSDSAMLCIIYIYWSSQGLKMSSDDILMKHLCSVWSVGIDVTFDASVPE